MGKNFMESRSGGPRRQPGDPVLPWSLSERRTWVLPRHRTPPRLLRGHETVMCTPFKETHGFQNSLDCSLRPPPPPRQGL